MKKDESLKEWVKYLQRESWQLELIVSAFSIFLLIGSRESVVDIIQFVQFNYSGQLGNNLGIVLSVLNAATVIFSIHLVAHLLVRGLWIGIIGLNSVIDNKELNFKHYSPIFRNRLEGKILSLDELVKLLDKFSSILFALAYLVLFSLFSVSIAAVFINFWANGIQFLIDLIQNSEIKSFLGKVNFSLVILLVISGLFYMIDFLTLGHVMKRFKFLSKVYYPIYLLYSFITFSFLYRSLYYTFISKFKKRYIFSVMIFYILFAFFLPDVNYYSFFPKKNDSNLMINNYYDNLRESDKWLEKASIPNDIISNKFLKLFIRYNTNNNSFLELHCSNFKPLIKPGIQSPLEDYKITTRGMTTNAKSGSTSKTDAEKMLECFELLYSIKMNDSLYHHLDFEFYVHPAKEQKGLVTYIETSNLEKGKNEIIITKNIVLEDTSYTEHFARIPFWLE